MNSFRQFFSFVFLMMVSLHAFASDWPVFYAPDGDYLNRIGVIETSGCAEGYGKVNQSKSIAISHALCQTYCFDDWKWDVLGDGQCYSVKDDFSFLAFHFEHYKSDDGTILYSRVTADYGNVVSRQVTMRLMFTSPQAHWFCVVQNQALRSVTCANDI